MFRFTAFILALGLALGPAQAMDSSAGNLTVTRMVDRLDEPWSIGFLPEGGVLITERGGGFCGWMRPGARRSKACQRWRRAGRAAC
ncbi:MAG: hypothetical protein RQ750_16915, partial [Roseovarius sp.]|nr:hypothetical protein [Roseovarius sp.]